MALMREFLRGTATCYPPRVARPGLLQLRRRFQSTHAEASCLPQTVYLRFSVCFSLIGMGFQFLSAVFLLTPLVKLVSFEEAMEADGYTWWIQRIKQVVDLYDEFRIDHFHSLAGFWAAPSSKPCQ